MHCVSGLFALLDLLRVWVGLRACAPQLRLSLRASLSKLCTSISLAQQEYPEMGHMARKQIQSSNMQVANCTTPANYFHILRRQVRFSTLCQPLFIFYRQP
jgi:2-oxoglutarate dehydrogenase complex dehydrogenase (E1) component-like enzyme